MIPSIPINVAAGGDTALIAGVAGRKIRVTNIVLLAAGTVVVTMKSSGGTALTGPLPLSATVSLWPGVAGEDLTGQSGHFETLAGEGLVINLGGAVQVSGWLNYLFTGP